MLKLPDDALDANEIFAPAIKNIEGILEKSLSAAIQTEMLPDKLQNVNYAGNKAFTSLIQEGQEINKVIDENTPEWSILVEGKTKGELVVYKRKIRDIESPNQSWQTVQRNKEYFWAISEGAHWFLEIFNKIDELLLVSRLIMHLDCLLTKSTPLFHYRLFSNHKKSRFTNN